MYVCFMEKEYKCKRCGYTATTKGNLKQHWNRKRICPAHLGDISIEYLRSELANVTNSSDDRKFACDKCQKKFSTAQGKYQHKRDFCKETSNTLDDSVQDTIQIMHKEMQELKNELSLLKNQTTIVANNTTTTTQQMIQVNQQVINAFGQERLDHISSHFLNQCVRRTDQGLIALLEKLHFDPVVNGENANVRITNRKLPLVEVNDGRQWKFEKKEKILNRMVDKGQDILQEHLEGNQERIKEQLSDSMWEHVQGFFERIDVRDETTIRNILDDVYIMLLNKTREFLVCSTTTNQ